MPTVQSEIVFTFLQNSQATCTWKKRLSVLQKKMLNSYLGKQLKLNFSAVYRRNKDTVQGKINPEFGCPSKLNHTPNNEKYSPWPRFGEDGLIKNYLFVT